MSGLVDFFAVVGVDKTAAEAVPDSVESQVSASVLQRFPAEDTEECQFPAGIEVLCQPHGWVVSHGTSPPTFFVLTLTDVSGKSSYCAVLTYHEQLDASAAANSSTGQSTLVGSNGRTSVSSVSHALDHVSSYAPKCLCLVSRHPLFSAFRNILCTMYNTMIDDSEALPRLVSQVVHGLAVPPPLKSPFSYFLTADSQISVVAHSDSSLPFADGSVLLLFQLIGIRNVLQLFAALLVECKIVFLSSRLSHLQAASHALLGLLYPLKFSYPLIPILPAAMDDFMSAPTPFIMGRLSDTPMAPSAQAELVVVDLNRGAITLGESVDALPKWDSAIESYLLRACTMVLQPSWLSADNAFSHSGPPSDPSVQDRELRAIFLGVWTHWLWNYRSCLMIQRIHDSFSVQFLPDSFVRLRHLDKDEILQKVLESQALVSFIQDKGLPFRECDYFDELAAEESCPDLGGSDDEIAFHMQSLAKHFPRESDMAMPRPTVTPSDWVLPRISVEAVESLRAKYEKEASVLHERWSQHLPTLRVVPEAPDLQPAIADELSVGADIALLQSCFQAVFEEEFESEANKMVRSLVRAFKSPAVRLRLAKLLAEAAKTHGNVLTYSQFSVLSKLVNKALQADTGSQSVSLAELLLPTLTTFCTELRPGVAQFLYMTCQNNTIWKETSFWTRVFHAAVQQHIVSMYQNLETDDDNLDGRSSNSQANGRHDSVSSYSVEAPRSGSGAMTLKRRAAFNSHNDSKTALKSPTADRVQSTLSRNFRFSPSASIITASAETAPAENRSESSSPMDLAAKRLRLWPHLNPARQDELSGMEEDTIYAQAILFASRMVWMQVPVEGGEAQSEEKAKEVINFVQRFFNGKASALGISAEHLNALYEMVPGLVLMHRENLDSVIEEMERRKSEEKERLSKPDLLDRESLLSQDIRCYLLPDGRDVGLGVLPDGPQILPAEGTLIVTTYRIIFKGTPLDCAAGDGVITRTMPLASILMPKRLSLSGLSFGSDGLLIQSTTFQLLRLCFAAGVTTPIIERIMGLLERMRFPSLSDRLYCYSKDRGGQQRAHSRLSVTDSNASLFSDGDSATAATGDDMPTVLRRGDRWTLGPADPGLDREYARCKLDSSANKDIRGGGWRVSSVNRTYRKCITYPSTLAVPSLCSDEQIAVIAQYFVHSRFPVGVWRDPASSAAILRSGSPLRAQREKDGSRRETQTDGAAQDGPIPMTRSRNLTRTTSDDGIGAVDVVAYLKACTEAMLSGSHSGVVTPSREVNGRAAKESSQEGRSASEASVSLETSSVFNISRAVFSAQASSSNETPPLYIIGNRRHNEDQIPDVGQNLVFLPVECPDVRAVRHSFRKLLRACAPPDPSTDASHFYSLVEESGWMEQIQCIMRLAGAVVDLIDVQSSSVLVSLEDGWDATAQVSSLAQLCLDPYYRTIEGFEVLVEKEWLAFGHRFSRRGQQLEADAGDDFAPIFLQFLDAVHQIMSQFPLSFEFNAHYLEFLAYHQSSLNFITFTLDSEMERVSMSAMDKEGRRRSGRNIWRHIKRQCSLSPIYCNLSYRSEVSRVLRPYSGIADLHIWQYYVRESLTDSARYDVEAESVPFPSRTWKDRSAADGSSLTSSFVNKPVSPVRPNDSLFALATRNDLDLPMANSDALLVDHLSCLLCEHRRLSSQVGDSSPNWQTVWRNGLATIKELHTETMEREVNLAKTHSMHNHRRASVEVLLKGKLTGQAKQAFSYPHRFVMHTYKSLTYCDSCKQLMWGVIRQGLQCGDCGYNSHYRCKLVAPSNCNEFKRPDDAPAPAPKPFVNKVSLALLAPETDYPAARARSASSTFYMSTPREQYHEGFLYKRGGIRKNWKMRWFVLNGEGMELCYYNAFQETHLRGAINLEEVSEVNKAQAVAGAPTQEGGTTGSFFEILTPKRTYLLMARSDDARRKWLQCINGCIQLQRNLSTGPPGMAAHHRSPLSS